MQTAGHGNGATVQAEPRFEPSGGHEYPPIRKDPDYGEHDCT